MLHKTEGTELGDIELKRSSYFFQVGELVDHLRGHPGVVPAVALWLTRSNDELFCNVLSHFDSFGLLCRRVVRVFVVPIGPQRVHQ